MRQVMLPNTLTDLWSMMSDMPHARVYAGGTDLLVQERNGLIPAGDLICLGRIPNLAGIEKRGDTVIIGAATPLSDILNHAGIRRSLPVLWQAAATLGSPLIRNLATLGGNICTASPAGDTLPPLVVLNAEADLLSCESSRRIKISELIHGPGQTDVKPGEIVSAIHIPEPRAGSVQTWEKIGKRNALACSIVSMAAVWWMRDGDRFDSIRIAWGSVGPTVQRFSEVENFLAGRRRTENLLREAGARVRKLIRPITDLRAGAEYRRQAAGNLILRLGTRLSEEEKPVP